MRIAVFIVCMVLVAGIVGLLCWREFSSPDINFVADSINDETKNFVAVQRLYAADVDFDKYEETLVEILNSTEYTDDEVFSAAIASGTPEFSPVFNISVYKNEKNEIIISGTVGSTLTENQKNEQFVMGAVSLEATAASLNGMASNSESELYEWEKAWLASKWWRTEASKWNLEFGNIETSDDSGEKSEPKVVIHNKNQLAVDISDAPAFSVKLNGDTGVVILRFTYGIEADTFMPKTALSEQLLQVEADISTDRYGNLDVKFNNQPYSSWEDLTGETE